MKKKYINLLIFFLTVILVFIGSFVSDAKNVTFPVYPGIKDAVDFWKKVYCQYSTRQGIIHDDEKLYIIYEVIELEDPKNAGATKRNQNKIKQAKKKYQDILYSLSKGNPSGFADDRVRALWGENCSHSAMREAQNHVRVQIGQKDRFREGVIRSGALIDEIKRIFRSNGLPEDLAFLPHVESSFDYQAYSKFGAAGIWQFMHGTGRNFMTINYTQDDRRDPIVSSHAAASLLKQNYSALGNWPMAITAYNHGLNGMIRAKKNVGDDFERILEEYDGRSFGFASRNFYAEFLAAKEIAGDYRKYFGDLQLYPPMNVSEVVMPGYVSIKDVMNSFNVDISTLKKYNLALRPPVFDGQKYIPKGYRLKIPKQNYARSSGRLSSARIHSNQLPSRFYYVQKGDTAGTIAKLHGVRLSDLIMANDLSSRATIYVGQNLKIPVHSEKIVLASHSENDVGNNKKESPGHSGKSFNNNQTKQKKSVSIPEVKKEKPSISLNDSNTEVTPSALEPDQPNISASDRINVSPTALIGDFKVLKIVKNGRRPIGIIQVQAEETLGRYADWLGVRINDIRKLNRIAHNNSIKIDERIKVPFTKISKNDFEVKRFEYHKELQEDFFSAYRIEGETIYDVEKGDNIWAISQKLDIPLWLIKKYNLTLDLGALGRDQKLRIPSIQKNDEAS